MRPDMRQVLQCALLASVFVHNSACASAHVLHVVDGDASALVAAAQRVARNNNVVMFVADSLAPDGLGHLCLSTLRDAGATEVLLAMTGGALPHPDVPFATGAVVLTQEPACKQPERRRTVSCWRLFLMMELLKSNINVFIADLDMVFLSSPFDNLPSAYDVSIMSDAFNLQQLAYMNLPAGGTAFETLLDPTQKTPFLWEQNVAIFNVGTMMVRATPRSMAVFRVVQEWLSNTSYWEQQVVSLQLLSFALQGALRLRVWDPRVVMNSGFWLNNKATLRHPPVAFHASSHGDKLRAMREFLNQTYPETEPFKGMHEVDFEGPYAVKL
jgi:hypothetical protein